MSNIIERYKEHREAIKWFIIQFFGEAMMDTLDAACEVNNQSTLKAFLNQIWFDLPDNKFNIIENPKGWGEFLNIIEE